MFLSRQQQREYVDNGGGRCPFYQSDNLSGGAWDAEYGTAYHEIACVSCGERWTTVYLLDHIYQMED